MQQYCKNDIIGNVLVKENHRTIEHQKKLKNGLVEKMVNQASRIKI